MDKIFVDSNSVFYDTYKLYREYIGYTHPFSYKQWKHLPENFKAAALYVQFYNEITLAWHKVRTAWAIEEEGVETINQYLIKNVAKIESDKNRFKPQYIYRVAYNCLYCICIDPSKNKDKYYNEVSESFSSSDDELSWFDFIGCSYEELELSETTQIRDFINHLDEEFQIFFGYVLGEISEVQACRALKRIGKFHASTLDPEARNDFLSKLVSKKSEEFKDRYVESFI